METVSLRAFFHRNMECIGIFFAKSTGLNNMVKKIQGIKWSQTQTCWYLPLSKENYDVIKKAIGNTAAIETNSLKNYLQKKNKIIAGIAPAKPTAEPISEPIRDPTPPRPLPINSENMP